MLSKEYKSQLSTLHKKAFGSNKELHVVKYIVVLRNQ